MLHFKTNTFAYYGITNHIWINLGLKNGTIRSMKIRTKVEIRWCKRTDTKFSLRWNGVIVTRWYLVRYTNFKCKYFYNHMKYQHDFFCTINRNMWSCSESIDVIVQSFPGKKSWILHFSMMLSRKISVFERILRQIYSKSVKIYHLVVRNLLTDFK